MKQATNRRTGNSPTGSLTRLHTRGLDDRGYPQMAPAFVDVLCGRRPISASTVTPATVDAARARLAGEYPMLSATVEARYIDGKTIRAVAQEHGVSLRTAHVRAWEGLSKLAAWCSSDTATIMAVLGQHSTLAIGKQT